MDTGIREDRFCGKIHKTILKGVTAYFNPGELVAIMGPSGKDHSLIVSVFKCIIRFRKDDFLRLTHWTKERGETRGTQVLTSINMCCFIGRDIC